MMYPPVLVAPPVDELLSLMDLKQHLRLDHSDEDALVFSLGQAAVAHFDGWRGILGRAIMPQTWSQDFDCWGDLTLSMPDVASVSVVGILDGVESDATEVELNLTTRGPIVTADGGEADKVRVTFVCGLPSEQLPAVQMAVKLLVGHWYENREAATEVALKAAPMAVQALVAPLRVVSI